MDELQQKKTEEFLRLYQTIKRKERELRRKLEELDAYDGYGAVPLDGMPRGASAAKDALIVEKRQDLRIALGIIEVIGPEIRWEVWKLITEADQDLDLPQKRILARRFGEAMSYEATARDLNMQAGCVSVHRIKEIEAAGIKKIRGSCSAAAAVEKSAARLTRDFRGKIQCLILEGHLRPKYIF